MNLSANCSMFTKALCARKDCMMRGKCVSVADATMMASTFRAGQIHVNKHKQLDNSFFGYSSNFFSLSMNIQCCPNH